MWVGGTKRQRQQPVHSHCVLLDLVIYLFTKNYRGTKCKVVNSVLMGSGLLKFSAQFTADWESELNGTSRYIKWQCGRAVDSEVDLDPMVLAFKVWPRGISG